MEFSPVECWLEHYDKEASWQNKKEGQVENLREMVSVRVMANNEKDHMLELEFTSRSMFLSFDSKTKMAEWMKKLCPLLGERHILRALLMVDVTIIIMFRRSLRGATNEMPRATIENWFIHTGFNAKHDRRLRCTDT